MNQAVLSEGMRLRNKTTQGAFLTWRSTTVHRVLYSQLSQKKIFSQGSGKPHLAQDVVERELHAVGGVEGEEAAVLVVVVAIAAGRNALARFAAGQEIGH